MDLRFLKGNSEKFSYQEQKEGTFYYIEDEKRFLINDMEIQDTNAVKEELNEKIDTVNSSLSATIENNVNALNSTISNNYNTLNTKINTKQDTLVSGQNIKTIGNEPVIGSGNIIITPQQAFTVNKNILSISGNSGYEWIGKKTSEKRNVLWIGTSIPAGDIQFNNN